jgi:hypothetical protein
VKGGGHCVRTGLCSVPVLGSGQFCRYLYTLGGSRKTTLPLPVVVTSVIHCGNGVSSFSPILIPHVPPPPLLGHLSNNLPAHILVLGPALAGVTKPASPLAHFQMKAHCLLELETQACMIPAPTPPQSHQQLLSTLPLPVGMHLPLTVWSSPPPIWIVVTVSGPSSSQPVLPAPIHLHPAA